MKRWLPIILMIIGIVLLPTYLTADTIQAEEPPPCHSDLSSCHSDRDLSSGGISHTEISRLISFARDDKSSIGMTNLELRGESSLQINLSLPFNVESHWTSVDPQTRGIIWQVGDIDIKFAVKDNKFIPTSLDDTWFVYGWFGPIEAITKSYNVKYPQWNNRHNGIDFAGRAGLEIISASDGIVTFTGNKIGKTVEINAGNNYSITYGHLLDIAVQIGDNVKTGDIIGHLGATETKNPHLHFEVDKIENDYRTAINPLTLLKVDWSRVVVPDADANRFYEGPQDPHLQPNFNWI